MNQLLFISGGQCATNLAREVERLSRVQWPFSLHVGIDGLPVDKLHGIKISLVSSAQIKDRRDILVPQSRCRPCFPEEALLGHFASEISTINNLQGNVAPQGGIVSFISDPHRSPP